MHWVGSSFKCWLLIEGAVPLVAIFIATVGATSIKSARVGCSVKSLRSGLLEALPFALFLSYCLVPSVSTTVFQSWACIAYEFDGHYDKNVVYYYYLRKDLHVQCSDGAFSSLHHDAITSTASFLLAVWPVGIVVLCAVTLLPCRRSLVAHVITPLSRATRFLHHDYKVDWFFWELLELVRRTVLLGWVIFIFDADRTFLRLVMALLFSVAALALLLSLKPYACTALSRPNRQCSQSPAAPRCV